MKKLFNWIVNWFLAIGGCFSARLETLYLSRDKQLMETIKNPPADLVSLEDLDF